MSKNHKHCLILNADYSPLCIIHWQRAMTWYIRYHDQKISHIDIIEFYKNEFIVGVNKTHPLPAVIKLCKFFKFGNCKVNFSRKNVFIRDEHKCQYCGNGFNLSELTYDHVIPKSIWLQSGSPTIWTNIVTACVGCNRKKGNKTPKEAKMNLLSVPKEPSKSMKYLPIMTHISNIKSDIPPEWSLYLAGYI
jgi:5-methylcytosine-specific restriction endonuclease McrA